MAIYIIYIHIKKKNITESLLKTTKLFITKYILLYYNNVPIHAKPRFINNIRKKKKKIHVILQIYIICQKSYM